MNTKFRIISNLKISIVGFSFLLLLGMLLFSCGEESTTGGKKTNVLNTETVVNVYTVRYKAIDDNLFKQFEQKKGIKVNVYSASPQELLKRMKDEANSTGADVVIFNDLTWMYEAKAAGLLQPFSTDSTLHQMPSRNTDNEGTWVGLSKWSLGYGCSKVAIPKPSLINTYQDIIDKNWKGRVLLTKAENSANSFLVATMIVEQGEAATSKWLKGLIKNLAMPPLATDGEVIQAIADGKGDLSLINASEHIRWTNSGNPDNFKAGEQIGMKVSYDGNNKTYYNIVSAGLSRNVQNRQNALQFIDFLISQKAQQYYCDLTFEYPTNVFTLPSDFLMNISGYKEKEINFNKIADNIELARSMMQKAGWE